MRMNDYLNNKKTYTKTDDFEWYNTTTAASSCAYTKSEADETLASIKTVSNINTTGISLLDGELAYDTSTRITVCRNINRKYLYF
jgi:hypothetical protein